MKKNNSEDLLLTPINNYLHKKKLIRERLYIINNKSKKYLKKYKKLKKLNKLLNITTSFLNATSLTTTIIGLTTFPPSLLISLCSTSISSIISGTTSVLNLNNKISDCYTAHLQLLDLYNDYCNKLFINNLSSNDLDNMLSNLNSKLGLILDGCQDISISSASTR